VNEGGVSIVKYFGKVEFMKGSISSKTNLTCVILNAPQKDPISDDTLHFPAASLVF
jgi:hypothetical protein